MLDRNLSAFMKLNYIYTWDNKESTAVFAHYLCYASFNKNILSFYPILLLLGDAKIAK